MPLQPQPPPPLPPPDKDDNEDQAGIGGEAPASSICNLQEIPLVDKEWSRSRTMDDALRFSWDRWILPCHRSRLLWRCSSPRRGSLNSSTSPWHKVSKCFLNPSASIIYIKKEMQPCLKKYGLPAKAKKLVIKFFSASSSNFSMKLTEFNDRFSEINSQLLTNIAAFSLKNSFAAFESLMELAKAYPDDFDPSDLDDLIIDLNLYIDNLRADARFAQVATISELGKMMVDTSKHLSFPLVYRLLKLVLVLPIATASVERIFSAVKIVKTDLRNRIGDGFMNDCIVSFVEQEFLHAISK
uniref:Zinc finger MYM-type protein 1-like isoform X2 n=1 Tax=Saccharum spontaneum TaxID=62335 RepID=A0A678T6B5_SACSP|nr:zinc finger MYM-type protein 1-like isoform X2 [Saccharum spontaneum]